MDIHAVNDFERMQVDLKSKKLVTRSPNVSQLSRAGESIVNSPTNFNNGVKNADLNNS